MKKTNSLENIGFEKYEDFFEMFSNLTDIEKAELKGIIVGLQMKRDRQTQPA